MAAELVSCPDCQRKLRVPDELVGKLVKCPTCGQTFTADPATQAPPPDPPPNRTDKVARTSKVARDPDEDDDRPRRRSRSDRDDEDDDDRPRRRRSRYGRDDDDDDDEDDGRRRRRDLAPHRADTVLTLGIIGIVLTFVHIVPLAGLICGIIAWVMGNADLAEMRAGRMDREGESRTNGGRVCGMIVVILHIVGLVLGLGFCCLLGLLGGRH